MRQKEKRWTSQQPANCSIILKATGQVIRWIGFGAPSRGKERYCDLSFGYALLPAFWSQGYMSEALAGMLAFAFTTTNARAISDTCDVRNLGSARVMEKAGLRLVERFAETDDESGAQSESYRYVIRREEWAAHQRRPALTISPATLADIEQLTNSFPDWGARQKHGERWQRQQSGAAIYLVARHNDQPVGHALLKWGGATDPHVAQRLATACPDLEDLFVLGDWRNQGIGGDLLRVAEALVMRHGFDQLGLSVSVENPDAQRLYERLGYRDAGFGPYVEQGSYTDEQGQIRSWEETCIYLIKHLGR